MTTPSNTRLLSSASSAWTAGSSDYSPTSTSTPFATPATSIAPSTFSRSGLGNRRVKNMLLSSTSSIEVSRHCEVQSSPTPSGSRSGTPASMEGPSNDKDAASAPTNSPLKQRASSSLTTRASSPPPAAALGVSSSELSRDAQDFFARAQAMGLRLTREDYERTRAGITAFLKAERVPAAPSNSHAGPCGTTEKSSGESKKNVANEAASPEVPSKGLSTPSAPISSVQSRSSASQAAQGLSPLARTFTPAWARNASSPMLSFFTAVVAPTLSPGSNKSHPSLDEIGSAEEKRRRKLKKMRLRVKRETERLRALGSNVEQTPLQSSPEAGGSCTFETPPSCTSEASKIGSSGSGERRRVGLRLDFDDSDGNLSPAPCTPPEPLRSVFSRRRSRGRTVSFDTSSPGELISAPMRHSASLDELSKRAWVSPHGTLRLLRSPVDPEGVFPGSPIDADDSGVFFDRDDTKATSGMPSDGWGTRHRRESSGASSAAEVLNSKMGRLCLLDQIMAHQTSPRRLYKEAKLREKAELERKQVLELEKAEKAVQQIAELAYRAEAEESQAIRAAETANAIKAANSDYPLSSMSTPNGALRGRKMSDAMLRATPINASASKGVRWITGMRSPRNLHSRMSTREHYDFVMHGISPGQPDFDGLDTICNIDNTPGPITFSASWDAESLLARGHDKHAVALSPFQPGLFSEDGRPELIGVSPSVADLFHGRQASAQGSSQAKLMRSISDGLAVMSPLSGRLVPSVQSRMGDLDFDEDLQAVDDQMDSLGALGKAPTFNAKRGLLFGTPMSSPPSNRLGQSPGRALGFLSGSATRLGFESDDARLGFASPRSALLLAHSGGALDMVAARREPQKIHYLSPRQLSYGAPALKHRRTPSRGWSRQGASDASETISPADVFGSAIPKASSSQTKPLPEPVKVPASGVHVDVFSDDEIADAECNSDIELSARKKVAVIRRARSHSPQSPLRQLEVGEGAHPAAMGLPAIRLEYGIPAEASTDASMSNDLAATKPIVGANGHSSAPDVKPASAASYKKGSAKSKTPGKASEKRKETPGDSAKPASLKVKDVQACDFKRMASNGPSIQMGDEVGWDQPDDSRLIKLVSEELQAALESGVLLEEPPARYYLLPPGFGQSKNKPSSVSYAGLIGQAIKSSSDMRLSLAEIYAWISTTYPFFERGDRGWQNSIRHNLSLNKSFIKIEREANMPGKGGWWGIKAGHEDRFQNGLYNAIAQKLETTKSKQQSEKETGDQPIAPSLHLGGRKALPASQSSVAETPAASQDAETVSSADASKSKKAKPRRKRPSENAVTASSQGSDDGDVPLKSRPVKRTKTESKANVFKATRLPLKETQPSSQASMSTPMAMDSMTPVKPHGSSMYASSAAGSDRSRNLPMLTDSASSPPSSPFTLMPPPTMQMTADHSVLKRKLATQHDGQLAYGSGFSPSLYGMQGSPLTNAGRGSNYRAMRGSALGGAFSFSNSTHNEVTSGSPLRRQNKSYGGNGNALGGSPKRLWSISSPVSSMRGSAPDLQNAVGKSSLNVTSNESRAKSPNSAARMAALAHSPIRSSPLRHASTSFGGSPSRSASAASMQMQLAMGGNQGGYGQMQVFGADLGMGLGATPGRTPGTMRFTSSISPMRRPLSNTSNGQMQMMNGHLIHQQQPGHGQQGWYLDDPFDVQSNLQHELEFSQMGGGGSFGNVMSGVGPMDGAGASPLRMMWNTVQAAGGVQAFTNGYHHEQQHIVGEDVGQSSMGGYPGH